MNFKDVWFTDEAGKKIVFTVEMQRELDQMGLPVEPASLDKLSRPRSREAPRSHSMPRSQERESRSHSRVAEPPPDFDAPATIQIDPQTGKYIGRMKWYNSKKGYGFIVRGGGEEIFFHKTGAIGDPYALQEGQWILYDVEETHKGPEATDVEPYEGDVDLLA